MLPCIFVSKWTQTLRQKRLIVDWTGQYVVDMYFNREADFKGLAHCYNQNDSGDSHHHWVTHSDTNTHRLIQHVVQLIAAMCFVFKLGISDKPHRHKYKASTNAAVTQLDGNYVGAVSDGPELSRVYNAPCSSQGWSRWYSMTNAWVRLLLIVSTKNKALKQHKNPYRTLTTYGC